MARNIVDSTLKLRNEFTSWVAVASLFFKSSSFRDEQEYRFVAIVPKQSLNSLEYEYNDKKYKMYHFRIVDGVLVPYIAMPFNSWNIDKCWVISSIGISPCLSAEHKVLGLKTFFESLDYQMGQCSIYESNIPLRY